MAETRIGLLGKTDFFRSTLFTLLRENGFLIEVIELPDLDNAIASEYDLLVMSADVAAEGGEEAFFRLLFSAKDFLLVGGEKEPPPSFISYLMSPEEVIARINGIIYSRKAGIEGLPVRSSPRVSVNVEVHYEFGGLLHRSTIQTLSARGAFIATLKPPARDCRLALSFELPGAGMIEAGARVLYRIEYDLQKGIIAHPSSQGKKIAAIPGMAVFFEEISEKDLASIRDFVERKTFA
jgi:hypothetical protein